METDSLLSDSQPSWRSRLRSWLAAAVARRLHVDERAFAVFRMLLGMTILFDLLVRATDLRAFYTDSGVYPRQLWREQFPQLATYSLHGLSGEPWLQAVLFGVTAIAAGCLVVGYRTKTATLVSLLLVVSLQLRNPLVLNGSDRLLSELLVVSLFLPLGTRWSVAAARRATGVSATPEVTPRARTDRESTLHYRFATVVALLYPVSLFFANGLLKTEGDHWFTGQALQYAFRQDSLTILVGNYLADYGLVLTLGSYLWAGLLLGSPLLVVLAGRARTLVVSVFLSLVLGMALSMAVGLFPPLLAALVVLWYPPNVWNRLEDAIQTLGSWSPAGSQGSHQPRSRHPGPPRLDGGIGGPSGRLSRFRERHSRLLDRLWSVVLVVVIGVILVWTASMVGVLDLPADSETLDPEAHQWEMFAPDPPTSYSRYVVAATYADGTGRNLLRGTALTAGPPADAAAAFPNFRWRQYLAAARDHPARVEALAQALCASPGSATQPPTTETPDSAIETIRITHIQQPISPTEELPQDRTTLIRHSC